MKRVADRYNASGLEAALADEPRPGGERKLDSIEEAAVVALVLPATRRARQNDHSKRRTPRCSNFADPRVRLGRYDEKMRRWVVVVALCGCGIDVSDPRESDPRDPFGPDVEPTAPDTLEIALDHLEPGWRVTTTRSLEQSAPTEVTQIADGTPMRIVGSAADVFIVTVTDASGALLATHAMHSPCTMAASRQLHVPHEFATIQAAIDAAQQGDTVKVHAGTYTESVTMRPGVCLLGSGAKRTILDAKGEARTLVDLTSAPGSVVSGFTLRGTVQEEGCARPENPFACSGDWYRAAIYVGGETWDDPTHDAPPLIINNVFEENDIGVMFYWRSNGVVRNNVFVSNTKGFIANHFQDRALVANNVFYNNAELAIGNQSAYLDIVDNIIAGSAVAVRFQYIQTGHIRCNLFWDNSVLQADYPDAPPRFEIGKDGNIEAAPKFLGDGDFRLQPGSPAINAGCHRGAKEADDSLPDLGVFGGPLGASIDL